MEHTQALEMNAPDRYVLGQLSAAEADAFEEHYFDCAVCADDVRLGMSIMEGGRRLMRQASEPAAPAAAATVVPIDTGRRRFLKWIPAAAAAALLTANVPLLMRMQRAVPVLSPIVGETPHFVAADRSEDKVKAVEVPEGKTVVLAVDVVPKTSYPRYEARVLRGKTAVVTYPLEPALFEDTVKIPLPDPGPGAYVLAIVGITSNGEEKPIDSHNFEVMRPAVNR